MPRYYFHYWNGSGLEEDHEGSDLPDVDAAHAKALSMANKLLEHWGELPPQIRDDLAFEIVDEAGRIVLFVPLSEGKEEHS